MRRNPDWYGATKSSPPEFFVEEHLPFLAGRYAFLVQCLDAGKFAQRALGALARLLSRSSRLSSYQFSIIERDGLRLVMTVSGFKGEVDRKDWVEAQRSCRIFLDGVQTGLTWRLSTWPDVPDPECDAMASWSR